MRFLFLLVGLLMAMMALGAEGAMKAGPNMAGPGHHRLKAAGGEAPPLDGMPAPAGAYSFRKLLSSYSGPSARIRRVSDNAEIDVNFLGFSGFTGAPWDEAAAASHCVGGCTVVTRYDQSGNARHLTNATPANQPQLILNCHKGLSCARTTAATQTLVSAAPFTPSTGVQTISAVANRSVGTTACHALNTNAGNRIQHRAGSAGFQLFGGVSGPVNIATTDNAWHAVLGITAGASATIRIETNLPVSGTAAGSTTAGNTTITGNNTSTCDSVEQIHWDSAISEAGVTALLANQQSFWLP